MLTHIGLVIFCYFGVDIFSMVVGSILVCPSDLLTMLAW